MLRVRSSIKLKLISPVKLLSLLGITILLSGCINHNIVSPVTELNSQTSSKQVSFLGLELGKELSNDFIKEYNFEQRDEPNSFLIAPYATKPSEVSAGTLLFNGHILLTSGFSTKYPEITFATYRIHPTTNQLTAIILDTAVKSNSAKTYLNCIKLKNNLLELFYEKYGGHLVNETGSTEKGDRYGINTSSSGHLDLGSSKITGECLWYLSDRNDIATGNIKILHEALDEERSRLIESIRKQTIQKQNESYKNLL